MARQYVGPDGFLYQETGNRQYVAPSGTMIKETSGSTVIYMYVGASNRAGKYKGNLTAPLPYVGAQGLFAS